MAIHLTQTDEMICSDCGASPKVIIVEINRQSYIKIPKGWFMWHSDPEDPCLLMFCPDCVEIRRLKSKS